MARINLGSGRWFDPSAAERFAEDTRWNGNNHVSVATGSQFEHEELYRTRKGLWVLHWWSQWQGTMPSYEEVTTEKAKAWLIDQDHADDAERFWPGTLAGSEV